MADESQPQETGTGIKHPWLATLGVVTGLMLAFFLKVMGAGEWLKNIFSPGEQKKSKSETKQNKLPPAENKTPANEQWPLPKIDLGPREMSPAHAAMASVITNKDELNPLLERHPEILQDKETMSLVLSHLISHKNPAVFKTLLTNHPELINRKVHIGWEKHADWGKGGRYDESGYYEEGGYDERLVPMIELIKVSGATEIENFLNNLQKKGQIKLDPIPQKLTKPEPLTPRKPKPIEIFQSKSNPEENKGTSLFPQQSLQISPELHAAYEKFEQQKTMPLVRKDNTALPIEKAVREQGIS